jgi:hypothetical protein
VWVDAAPFNQNGLYVNRYGDTMYAGLGVTTGSSSSPSVYFNLYSNSGFYSPAPNEFGVVVSGTQRLNVNPGGINVAGVVTATSFVGGVVTATSFVGDGSGLTGAGSTVADDTTTDSTFYPVFTSITNGTITASKVSTTKLTFNPSTGTLTATDINSSSDSILKENIETVEGALDKVNNLRGVKFNWKEDGRPSYGVIAQELEQVLPELVSDTDPKTVNYNGIISVLIEAVKELTQRVEELENKS